MHSLSLALCCSTLCLWNSSILFIFIAVWYSCCFSPPFYTDGHVGVLFTFVLWPTVLQRTSKNMPVDDFMHTFMLHTYLDVELPGHNDSQFSKCCHQFTFPLIIYEKSTYFALSTLFFFFFIPYLIVVILVGVNSYHFNLYLSID